MIKRKKKILLIQVAIFFLATSLIYNTYKSENIPNEVLEINSSTKTESNSFENVEYAGLDLNGNRYSITAEKADFETQNPEVINMKKMIAYFYFKDNSVLRVEGDQGFYNNKTFDMKFEDNVKATYEANYLFSDLLIYSNNKGLITISGNVRGESIQGKVIADKAEYDLTKKTIDLSMFENKRVNVKLKNK